MNGIPGKGSNRQDSIRSGYLSDHETKAGTIVHQQISVDSIQSQDSRLCYLTSSEVKLGFVYTSVLAMRNMQQRFVKIRILLLILYLELVA